MADFFSRIAARTLGLSTKIRPETVSRFQSRSAIHAASVELHAPRESLHEPVRPPKGLTSDPPTSQPEARSSESAPGVAAASAFDSASNSVEPKLRPLETHRARSPLHQPEPSLQQRESPSTDAAAVSRRAAPPAVVPVGERARIVAEVGPIARSTEPKSTVTPVPRIISPEAPTTLIVDPPEAPRLRNRVVSERRPGKDSRRPDRRSAETVDSEPTIHVSIGRVEVQAVPAAPAQALRSVSWSRGPMLSLEDYRMRRREEDG